MKNPNNVEKMWKQFTDLCIKDITKISDIQLKEMRRCFFAGGNCTFILIVNGLSNECNEATKEDLEMLNYLSEEFQQFAKSINEGKA